MTFAWTWTIWWGAVAARALSIDVPVGLVVFLSGPGPLLGTLFVLRRSARGYRRGFRGRTVDPRRVPGTWWLAMTAVAILPALVGYLGSAAVGRPAAMDAALSAGAITFAIGFALAAGLVEEPGWRGVGFLTPRFWAFNLSLALLSVLYAWMVNGSGGSVLIALVAHAGTNVAGGLIPQDAVTRSGRLPSCWRPWRSSWSAAATSRWRPRGARGQHPRPPYPAALA